MLSPAKLVLENGTIFIGSAFGAEGETIGEVCFNTGMTGYQEIITDPSYCGQLITMTYPHIGNYGVNLDDCESNNIQASGLIIREENIIPSNFRSMKSLGDYLREEKIVGIQKIEFGIYNIPFRQFLNLCFHITKCILRNQHIDQSLAKIIPLWVTAQQPR